MHKISFTATKDEKLTTVAIREVVNAGLPKSMLLCADIYVNDSKLQDIEWESTILLEGQKLEIIQLPKIIATATALAAVGFAVTSLGAIVYGLNYGVSWASNKLFPPNEPDQINFVNKQDIDGATNPYNLYGKIPAMVGYRRCIPHQLVRYYTAVNNNDIEVRHLFVVSAGDVEVYDLRRENTPVENLEGIEYYIYRDWRGEPLKWFDNAMVPTQENHRLDAVFVRETPVDTTKLAFIFNCPYGMYNTHLEDGKLGGANIWLYFKFTEVNTGEVLEYNYLVQKILTQTVRYSYSFDVPKGKYICEISCNAQWDVYFFAPINQDFAGRRFYLETYVIETQFTIDKKAIYYTGQSMTLIEMRAIASDSLSGGLNSINCMASLSGKKSDGTYVKTRNPALLTRRILTDPDLVMGTENIAIDDESFDAFEAHCDYYGFYASKYVEEEDISVGQVAQNLCEIGQGVLVNQGSKYYIYYDNPLAPHVDTLTARTSWGTTITTAKPPVPVDQYRVFFQNEDVDFQQDERKAPENVVNPNNIQTITKDYIVDADTAYKFGTLAKSMLVNRGSVIVTNTDWRGIDYKPGQKILFQHPGFYRGVGAGDVVELLYNANGFVYAVRIDNFISLQVGINYVLRSTKKYSQVESQQFWTIVAQENASTDILYFDVPYQENLAPKIGTLVGIGVAGNEGLYCLIRKITRTTSFYAKLEMIPATDNFYDAIKGESPPFVSSITSPTQYDRVKPYAPIILNVVANETTATKNKLGDIILNAQVSMSYVSKENISFSYYIVRLQSEETGQQVFNFETKDSFTLNGLKQSHTYNLSVSVVSKDGKESDVTSTTFNVVGLLAPPPSITNLTAQIDSVKGIMLQHDNVDVIDFSHYKYSGTGSIQLSTTNPFYLAPTGTGNFTISAVAVDLLGIESYTPAQIEIAVQKPLTPVITHSVTEKELILSWNDCKSTFDIKHYRVTDIYTAQTQYLNAMKLSVSARQYGEYVFSVEAIDLFGNVSTAGVYDLEIPQIEKPIVELEITGGILRAKWQNVSSYFPIDRYDIFMPTRIVNATTKSTFYDIEPNPNNTTGTFEIQVTAVDTAGNRSSAGILSYSVSRPQMPQVNVAVSQDKRNLAISWDTPISEMPILSYDVVRRYKINDIFFEENYGTFDTSTINIEPLSNEVDNATHYFLVRARNGLGQVSDWGETSINITAPSKVFVSPTTIDNNVLLYWTAPQSNMFAIKEYEIYDIDSGYVALRTKADTLFASFFEEQAGQYEYGIIPVDLGGNRGEMSVIKTSVDQPPDFEIFDDKPSTFNGEKINFVLDGKGGMLAGIPDDTWQENIDKVAAIISVDDPTWQDKIDNEMLLFSSPSASGTYTEIVDVGTVIASTNIVVTVTSQIRDGDPILECKIETSLDGTIWTVLADNSFNVYGTNFQYVRYTFSISSGILYISNIQYTLKVKQKTDSGVIQYLASAGLEGVQVDFRTNFIDVKGTPLLAVVDNRPTGGTYPYTAYSNFVDVQRPIGFKVFVLDKNGDPVDAKVSWQANGV